MANLSFRKTAIAATAAAIVLPVLSPASYAQPPKSDAAQYVDTQCPRTLPLKEQQACLTRIERQADKGIANSKKRLAAADARGTAADARGAAADARGAAADVKRTAAEDAGKCIDRIQAFPLAVRQKLIAEAGTKLTLDTACDYAKKYGDEASIRPQVPTSAAALTLN